MPRMLASSRSISPGTIAWAASLRRPRRSGKSTARSDCRWLEAKAQGTDGKVVEAPAVGAEQPDEITRAAGAIGHSRPLCDDDPGARSRQPTGQPQPCARLGWAKSHTLHTGQTPVLSTTASSCRRYFGQAAIAKIVKSR